MRTADARQAVPTNEMFERSSRRSVFRDDHASREVVVNQLPRQSLEDAFTACERFQLVTAEVRNDEAVAHVDRKLIAGPSPRRVRPEAPKHAGHPRRFSSRCLQAIPTYRRRARSRSRRCRLGRSRVGRRQDREVVERNVPAVEVRWRRRDADGRVRRTARPRRRRRHGDPSRRYADGHRRATPEHVADRDRTRSCEGMAAPHGNRRSCVPAPVGTVRVGRGALCNSMLAPRAVGALLHGPESARC